MAIVFADDSDGNTFQIWAQEQAMSCGIASIWMARGMAQQATFDESEWELAYRTYHAAVAGMSWQGGRPPINPYPVTLNPDDLADSQNTLEMTVGAAGIYGSQVADMLRHEGYLVSHARNAGVSRMIDTAKIGTAKPAIALVGWYDSTNTRRGGHFIVAARRNSIGQIVFLDPWGGRLNEVANTSRYPGGGMIEEIVYVTARP